MVVTRRGRATAASRPDPVITAVQDGNNDYDSVNGIAAAVTPDGAIAEPSENSWQEMGLNTTAVVTPTSNRHTKYKGTGVWEYFLNELVRPKVVSENPGITFGQVSTIASWMYKTLPAHRKQVLKNDLNDGGSPSADDIFTKELPRERTIRLFKAVEFLFQANVQYQQKW